MKIKILFVAAYMAISLEACHEKGKTDFGANWYIDSGMTVYELNNGCTVRDSIGEGPMNEKMTIMDKDGKVLAEAGCASEWGCMMMVRFLYDEEGSVRGLLRSLAENEDSDEAYHDEVLHQLFEKDEDDERRLRHSSSKRKTDFLERCTALLQMILSKHLSGVT